MGIKYKLPSTVRTIPAVKDIIQKSKAAALTGSSFVTLGAVRVIRDRLFLSAVNDIIMLLYAST